MSAVTRLYGRVSLKTFKEEQIMTLCAKFHTFVPICTMVKLTALTKIACKSYVEIIKIIINNLINNENSFIYTNVNILIN